MTTDLDALEALAKAATPGPRFPDSTAAAMGMNEGERATVFDAYEPNDRAYLASTGPTTVLALIAELRQERERADIAEDELDQALAKRISVSMRDVMDARAALSRAEETIEKFNQLRLKLNADPDYLVTKASLGRRIHALLTEYSRECSIE